MLNTLYLLALRIFCEIFEFLLFIGIELSGKIEFLLLESGQGDTASYEVFFRSNGIPTEILVA